VARPTEWAAGPAGRVSRTASDAVVPGAWRPLNRIDALVQRKRNPGSGLQTVLAHDLQAFSLQLLDKHLQTCVVDAASGSDDEARAKVREASEAISRLVRS